MPPRWPWRTSGACNGSGDTNFTCAGLRLQKVMLNPMQSQASQAPQGSSWGRVGACRLTVFLVLPAATVTLNTSRLQPTAAQPCPPSGFWAPGNHGRPRSDLACTRGNKLWPGLCLEHTCCGFVSFQLFVQLQCALEGDCTVPSALWGCSRGGIAKGGRRVPEQRLGTASPSAP